MHTKNDRKFAQIKLKHMNILRMALTYTVKMCSTKKHVACAAQCVQSMPLRHIECWISSSVNQKLFGALVYFVFDFIFVLTMTCPKKTNIAYTPNNGIEYILKSSWSSHLPARQPKQTVELQTYVHEYKSMCINIYTQKAYSCLYIHILYLYMLHGFAHCK